MTISRLAGVAAVAACALPAIAVAAPDRSTALDAITTTYRWDSKLGTGFTTLTNLHDKIPCGTPLVHDCDFTLVKVTGAGALEVANQSADPNAIDTDLYVYESDADGTQGPLLATSAQSSPTPNEATAVESLAGENWFLVEIDYTDNVGGTIHGSASFTPAPPEEVAPAAAG
jgi:hypothetical protein